MKVEQSIKKLRAYKNFLKVFDENKRKQSEEKGGIRVYSDDENSPRFSKKGVSPKSPSGGSKINKSKSVRISEEVKINIEAANSLNNTI